MAIGQQTTNEQIKITISKDAMTATVYVRKPGNDSKSISTENILEEIYKAGIVYGIDEEAVEKIVKDDQYNTPIKVAIGKKPKRGDHAQFEYHFETSLRNTPKEDEDGRIDYHELSSIQSVSKGDLLVTKIPPKEGIPGKNVYDKDLVGPPGKDIPFNCGKNTEVSDNGLELRATASGAIVYISGKVAVDDIIRINGDVDFNVGNIDCKGSVIVSGGVKAGFSIKVEGNLEIGGNVEDADINVKGNILVKGGFFGESKGAMHADGDIMLKYAENQKITSGGTIIVGGELINCEIVAAERLEVTGSRGKIIGGLIKAGKEIKTATAGSDAGTITHLYVAYNHDLMTRYQEKQEEVKRITDDNERVKEALYSLYKLELNGQLTPDKIDAMNKLKVFKQSVPESLKALQTEIEEISEKINEISDAQIVITDMLHAGVNIHFGIVYREIIDDIKKVRILLDHNNILMSKIQ